jgi:hypothetical protein
MNRVGIFTASALVTALGVGAFTYCHSERTDIGAILNSKGDEREVIAFDQRRSYERDGNIYGGIEGLSAVLSAAGAFGIGYSIYSEDESEKGKS